MLRRSSQTAGTTLVEMLIYLVVLTLFTTVLMGAIVLLIQSFNRAWAIRDLAESGGGALERLVREVRRAESVNDAGSVFNQSPGQLALNTTDDEGTDATLTVATSDGALTLQQGIATPTDLIGGHTFVSSLIFRKLATTTTSLIKIELALGDDRLPNVAPVNFSTSAVLRGGY